MSDPAGSTGKKPGMFGRLFGRGAETPQQDAEEPRIEVEQALAEPAGEGPDSDIQELVDVAVDETKSEDVTVASETEPAEPAPKQSWFQRLKSGLSKTSSKLTDGITSVFTKSKLDAASLDDLEDLLIQADLGVDMAMRITDRISRWPL